MENTPAIKKGFVTPAKMLLAGVFLAALAAVPFFGNSFGVDPAPQYAGQASGAEIAIAPSALPARFGVEKLGIDAVVQQVGTNAAGNMAAPTNAFDVAWYKGGTRPGDLGNAVIAGHVNTRTEPIGVFYKLEELNNGDIVTVTDVEGKVSRFRVIEKKVLDYDAPPEEVFGPINARRLNLITCVGDWLPDQRTYTQRLVVVTELIP